MPVVTVTTTYLELRERAAFRPALSDAPELQLIEAQEPLPAFYRFLYGTAGRDHVWIDRHSWSDEQLRAYLAQPNITVLVLYVRGTPAGYIELNSASHEPGTEVAYFGLFSPFHGRGLGKHLLSLGVQRAYHDGAARVWLHTCTLDGPHALANYQARGFTPYKVTTHEQELPPVTR